MMQAFPCIRSALTLVMDPLVANHLKEEGFDNPDRLSRYLSENFKMTAGQFWGSDVIYSLIEPNARNGIEPFASWLKLPEDAEITPYTGKYQYGGCRRGNPGTVAHYGHVVHPDSFRRQMASRKRNVSGGRKNDTTPGSTPEAVCRRP